MVRLHGSVDTMAIDFDADGEDCTHAGFSLGDPQTILVWFNPNSIDASDRQLTGQSLTAGESRTICGDTTGTGIIRMIMSFSGTNPHARSATGTITAGAWHYVAFRLDSSGAQDVQLFHGDLDTEVTEVSYGVTQESTGTILSTDSDFRAGNAAAQNNSANAVVAFMAIWPGTALTLAQIQAQQYFLGVPIVPGCELFTHYGIESATGTQPDWSGNGNNGTITGTPTLVDHVPIPIFLGDSDFQQEAAAAAGMLEDFHKRVPHYAGGMQNLTGGMRG